MSHTVAYKATSQIIEIKFQGDVTLNELKELFLEAVRVAKEQNCFLTLSDYRAATVKLSAIEIYELTKLFSAALAPSEILASKFKRALVVAKDLKDFRFFDDVSANRGQNTKIFQDVAEAEKWLTNS